MGTRRGPEAWTGCSWQPGRSRQGAAPLAAGVRVWTGGAGRGAEFKEPGRAWRAEPRKVLET